MAFRLVRGLSLCLFCAAPLAAAALDFNSPGESAALAASLAAQMRDEEALAQTLMFGWTGQTPSDIIMRWISERRIGGVKVFGRNAPDNEPVTDRQYNEEERRAVTRRLAQTIGEMQRAAMGGGMKIPLLVATDQEGGMVRHVKGSTSETPGNMAVGASGYPMDAYLAGYYIARELAAIGINMNFAPSVDLYTDKHSSIIGSRAFGDDPVNAGILGAAFVKGQAAAGVIATAKHFPGHGDTPLDSHGTLPSIDADFETLWERELVPYRIMAGEGLGAVMSGHLSFPRTESAAMPASLSPFFMRTVLREQIGFRGLVVTDEMEKMKGATLRTGGSVVLAAKLALEAGNDMLMLDSAIPLNDEVWTSLLAAMKTEPAFGERVRDAARRVLAAKLEYLRGPLSVPPVPDLALLDERVPDREGQAFFQELSARSVTVIHEKAGVLPLSARKAGKVALIAPHLDFFSAGIAAFGKDNVKRAWFDRKYWADCLEVARGVDTVVFSLRNDGGALFEEGLRFLRAIRDFGKRVIVISVYSPANLTELSWTDAIIAVYGHSGNAYVSGFSVLSGRVPALGTAPFNVSKSQ